MNPINSPTIRTIRAILMQLNSDSDTDMASTNKVRTVAIDVDSVLADVMVIWVDEYNQRNKTNVSKADIVQWDIPTVLPISAERVYDIFTYVWKHRWQEIPPTEPKIGEVTRRFNSKGLRIAIITKRERPTVPYVANWLDYHDIFADELVFIYDAVPKANYPFDVLIDDAPKNLIDVTPPKSAILFEQPWNKDFRGPVRIKNLSEAVSMF